MDRKPIERVRKKPSDIKNDRARYDLAISEAGDAADRASVIILRRAYRRTVNDRARCSGIDQHGVLIMRFGSVAPQSAL